MAGTRRLGLSMFVALLTALASAGIPAYAAIVYENDFETGFGPEWTSSAGPPTIVTTPFFQRHFLGEFVNGTVSLNLGPLPAHTTAHVEFDLFVLRSWDGMNQELGCTPTSCESWRVGPRGGPTPIDTNFNNIGGFPAPRGSVQAFPDNVGGGVHPFHTGAVEVGSLGLPALIQDAETQEIGVVCCFDAVYHFELAFPHQGPQVTLDFTASDLQILDPALQQQFDFFFPDESWGLDNVKVSVGVPEPPLVGLLGVAALVLWALGAVAPRRRDVT